MQADCFELHDDIGEPTGLFAAGGGLDEVQQGRPAHEAVERRVGLVKNGPQVLVRVLVPPFADGRSAAGEMRGREQWSTFHGYQRPLWYSKKGFDVRLGSAQRRRQSADQLSGKPVLRLCRVARKAGCLIGCSGG